MLGELDILPIPLQDTLILSSGPIPLQVKVVLRFAYLYFILFQFQFCWVFHSQLYL